MTARDNSFDAIRHLASATVLIYHAQMIAGSRSSASNDYGFMMLAVFFTLSGYLITMSWERRQDWRIFLIARARRIFPLAIAVALACTAVFGPLLSDDPFYWQRGLTYQFLFSNALLLVPRYELPGVLEGAAVPHLNGSVWTLRYEMISYGLIAIGGVTGFLNRWTALAMALMTTAAYELAIRCLVPTFVIDSLHLGQWFAAGSALYLWRSYLTWLWPLGVVAFAVSALAVRLGLNPPTLLGAYAVLVLAQSKLLPWPKGIDLSYGTYLWGMPVQQLVHARLPGSWWTELFMSLPIIVILAYLSWCWIEQPAMRWRISSNYSASPD